LHLSDDELLARRSVLLLPREPMTTITFLCPLPSMDIAMLIARVVPGLRERAFLAVARPKTGPWILSPAGAQTLLEHGGGKYTFQDTLGDAARAVRVHQALKLLSAVIVIEPPAPILLEPPVEVLPVAAPAPAPAPAPAVEAVEAVVIEPVAPAPAPIRQSFPAQRTKRRFA